MILCLTVSTAKADVLSVRTGQNSKGARIVLDLTAPLDHRAFLLAGPPRLVVDVATQTWKAPKNAFIQNPLIKGYRSGTLEPGLTRVVFDLRGSAVIERTGYFPRSAMAKDRLVIDLAKASDNLFRARLSDVFGKADIRSSIKAPEPIGLSDFATMRNEEVQKIKTPALAPVPRPDKPKANKKRIYTVIIDAGHGGEDPGAIAPGGIKEKNITLAVARELRRQLEETGRYRVVMTRNKDVYIRLRQRLQIARDNKGDLFISLHADKIDRKGVRGASIYTLSKNASDSETERLAESENNAGVVAGVDLSEESEDVANILLDLAMREKVNESGLFARFLESAFRESDIRLLPNSHRSAGFAVLKAPDIPSVLIEIGFLSNPEEAKLLTSSAFQKRISAAIVNGTDAYFGKIEALQKL
jgi:N-acetylmuramoyl-L-alanine amidase